MKNKIVVITGGNGNVGSAAAKRFSDLGARVFIIVRKNLEDAQSLIQNLSNQELNHKAFLASITDTLSIQQVVDEINKTAGKCDLLINAAGITRSINNSEIEQCTDEIIDEILINNIRGTFAVIREFVPLLKNSKDSLVVNITSAAGLRASQSNVMYGASKIALELITKTLSKTLSPNIRVVAVCPGILEHPTSGATKPLGWNEKMAKEIPLGRVGTADDVVATIEALATTLTYVTGSSIILDGGRLA
jgi:NAD(P)-dependent dehydrogenase (short-subunit alcohol dehydrogenase family)